METTHRKPIWTYIIIATCVAIFIIQQITPYSSWATLEFWPAYAYVFPWSFITAIFLHASIEQLVFNMIAVLFFGYTLENMLGGKIFLIIFFLSGIIGNVGYLLTSITGLTNLYTPAIGASGAIYGIIGTLVVLIPLRSVYLYGLFTIPFVFVVAFWLLLDIIGLFAPSGIAEGAHLGGIVFGAICGFYIRKRMPTTRYSYTIV
ncbi:MAG: rhomboid family intramembrane serine protease [Nitrososphaeria archaeon]|jgi:membrane associated rhomboid family serine protease